MNGYGSIWNKIPGLMEALGNYIKEGLSAKKTAETLSELAGQRISKNSCIGKARRDNLPAFQSGDNGKYERKPRATKRQVPHNITRPRPVEYQQPEPPPLPVDFLGLTILDLPLHGCRYPDGEGPFLFCGQPQHGESSYCAYHHRICCYMPERKDEGKQWFALRDLKSHTIPIRSTQQNRPR